MTRKSKQAGGHNPLTYSERSKLTSYGTQSVRLTTDSQLRFGDCCLQLNPAVDPVVTPSGHIYSREAIVSYLLTKRQEINDQKKQYEAQISTDARTAISEQQTTQTRAIQTFIQKDQGCLNADTTLTDHTASLHKNLKRDIDLIDDETQKKGNKRLKEISYWLSEAQPEYTEKDRVENIRKNVPKDRPDSPMSGNPLRLKDLVSIQLVREGDGDTTSGGGKCMCAVSDKAITTQPVILIKKTGVVILKDVYESVVRGKKGKSMLCPTTGKKFKEKDVLELQKGKSGFAASGDVIASKYTPTMT